MGAATLSSPTEVTVHESSTEFFEDEETVVEFTFTGDQFQADTAVIQPEDINHRIDGEITEPIELSIANTNTRAEYGVQDSGDQPVETINFIYRHWDWSSYGYVPSPEDREQEAQNWASENCENVDPDPTDFTYYYEEEHSFFGTHIEGWAYCSIPDELYAQVGELQSTPDIIMETEFEVNDEDGTETVEISSGQDQGNIGTATVERHGEEIAKFNFQGGLESGWNYPVPTSEKVAFTNEFDGNFRLIEASSYENDYKSLLSEADSQTVLEQWHSDWYDSYDSPDLQDPTLNYNNQIINTVSTYHGSEFFDYADSNEELFTDEEELTDGVVELDGDREAAYPQFQVIVKADEVGWSIPSADPFVEEIEAPDQIDEGSVEQVTVHVGNHGDGAFDGNAYIDQCTGEFTSLGISHGVNVDPGETESVDIDVSFASGSYDSQVIEGSCEVHLQDLREDETITEQVELEGVQADECTQGSRSEGITSEGQDIVDETSEEVVGTAEGQRTGIYYCIDGFEQVLVEECSSDETVSSRDGELTCTERTGTGDGNGNGDSDSFLEDLFGDREFTNPFENLFDRLGGALQIIHTALAATLGLIVAGFGYRTARWIDGERSINGRFKPFARRKVSRVQRGRMSIGAVAAIVSFIPGFSLGLWIPFGVYLAVILLLAVIGILTWYFKTTIPFL